MEKEVLKQYAENKVLEAFTSAIESAYNDGYKAGYNDGFSQLKLSVLEEENDGVEYIDLGLRSGTKWSSSYLTDKDGNIVYMSYDEADKLNIPAKEQFEELMKNCAKLSSNKDKTSYDDYYLKMNGKNTKTIKHPNGYWYEDDIKLCQSSFLFWLKDTREEDEKSNWIDIATGEGTNNRNLFKGFKIPVMLVKKS